MTSSPWLWSILTAAVAVFVCYGAYRASYRIGNLKRENSKLAAEALEAVQMKKDFVSRVSHELKAPLASMQETTHLLLERIPGPLTEKQRRLLDLNLQSGKRLATMIGNLLDLSRLEAGIADYDMHDHDLREVLQNVVMERSAEAREKSLRIVTRIDAHPLIVRGDPPRLSQVFSNLLENAIHFSAKGGVIKVIASVHDGAALISITDNGPGVADIEKKKIFEAFHSLTTRKNKMRGEGFGLGLAIAHAITTAHNGIIWLTDNPEGGSVFSVLLPGPEGRLASDRLDDLHLDIA
jgi:two-component system, NtrC family, sensor histidine kinase GlrK